MKVKCNKCGYVGEETEFPKGRDFLQQPYIKSCPKNCGNMQSPGGASLRMMPNQSHPFEYIRESSANDPLSTTLHNAGEAS